MAYEHVEVTEVADWVPVGTSALPAVFEARFREDVGGGPDLELTFAVRTGSPECREVRIKATAEGHEVRASDMRRIRVEDLMEQAIKELRVFRGHGDRDPRTGLYEFYDKDPGHAEVQATRGARAARKVRMTDELLREVAEVYRANVANKPLEAVQDRFDKAHRTAALYVAKARERGYLNPALRGKAGEQKERGTTNE